MKKNILLISCTLFCLNIFAQETKPCLFIGRYDIEKKGICSNRTYIKEAVYDKTEYEAKRLKFREEHKDANPSTSFVSDKQCVVVYEYQMKISGFKCTPTVHRIEIGASVEACVDIVDAYYAKYPKEFNTKPTSVFTWQGVGKSQKEVLKEDFGGVSGTFSLVDKSGGESFMVAQLKNNTTAKLATVLLQLADGKMEVEYIEPGVTLTKKYVAKKLEIQVLYQDSKESKPINITNFVKDKVRKQLINENGKLKSTNMGAIGVRG
jgi:hypothetical protein